MDFIDLRTLLTITHLFGVAIGAGGAFLSDFVFLGSMKDKRISKDELSTLTLMSRAVWVGVSLLVVSGAGMFALNPEAYLASSKFLAKMAIVAIIIINGAFFHFLHLPHIKRSVGKRLFETLPSGERGYLFFSGAISVVSWTSALILGAFRSIPYEFWTIMLAYGIVLAGGIGITFLASRKFTSR